MSIVKLFGPPDPQDKNVIAAADAVNLWPLIGNDGRLAWRHRPGYVMATNGWSGWPPGGGGGGGGGGGNGCIPTFYYWSSSQNPNLTWSVGVDGTITSPRLYHFENSPIAGLCYTTVYRFTNGENIGSRKWKVPCIYRNDTYSKLSLLISCVDENNTLVQTQLSHSTVSKPFHINLIGLESFQFDSTLYNLPFDPTYFYGSIDYTQQWIECIKFIEVDNFGAENPFQVYYD